MNQAIEQSIKAKLKQIEEESGIKFNRLLDTLFLERILARIGKSNYKTKLIFKGGRPPVSGKLTNGFKIN